MGMASSRVVASGVDYKSKAPTWHGLQCGMHYSRQDLRLWPQLEPLAQWFTAQDTRRLHRRLHSTAGSTGLLTLNEFLQWLEVGSRSVNGATDKGRKPERPIETTDVMTPPQLGNQQRHQLENHVAARDPPPLLEKHLQHVFLTFADGRGDRVYALEFLATLVVISRAIWDFQEKMTLLVELFHDPAASTSKAAAYASAQRLKETDVARLLLCVMNGIGRATQGVARVWQAHELQVAAFARRSASHCVQIVPHSGRSISSEDFRAYVAATPALHEFLALFSGEELRNPLTFAPSAQHFSRQAHLYERLLRQYVTFEGRPERRRASAALLIQSVWRRRCSVFDAQRRAQDRVNQRHKSATQLQGFFKHHRIARELEARAEIERAALNGGVFTAGIGPTIGAGTRSEKSNLGSGAPIRLLGTFADLNVKLSALAASSTFALGVQDGGQSLFAWGRCIPRIYDAQGDQQRETSICLTHVTPRRLHLRMPRAVIQVSCGLRHALALSEDGMVLSWGFNDHGQLGHGSSETLAARTSGQVRYDSYYDERSGNDEELLATPTRLLYFEGCEAQQADPIPVAQVCCGDYYCMALSRAGDVFTWGEASEGQLGHGETHEFYQVGLADRHMASSAYTFLPQPEPVLALSDVRVTQVACGGNHSVALSADGATSRLFEWGNWGRRRGIDSEHAFVPEEKSDTSALRLRHVAVGDHHILAEGASVWLKLATRTSGEVEVPELGDRETGFYVELLAGTSSSPDAIEHDFMGGHENGPSNWTCCLVDLDVDDLGEDEDVDVTSVPNSRPSTVNASSRPGTVTADSRPGSVNASSRPGTGNVEVDMSTLWQRRAARFALSLDRVEEFDPRSVRLLTCRPSSANNVSCSTSYTQGVDQWLRGRVSTRLVVMPRGKTAGFYMQFRLPLSSNAPNEPEANNGDTRGDDDDDPSSTAVASGVVLELAVCGSNTAERSVGRRGFSTHVYHPAMASAAKRLKQQQLRARAVTKKRPTVALTETNGIFVLEIDQSVLTPLAPAASGEAPSSDPPSQRLLGTESEAELEAETIIGEIGHRVLELQEAGALAVLVVLDLFDAEAFALQFADESGIFVPVLMVTRQSQAVVVGSYGDDGAVSEPDVGDSTRRKYWTVQELLMHMLASPTPQTPQQANAMTPRRPSMQTAALPQMLQVPPQLMARCFYRADTAAVRARGAFANGAAAVLFVANESAPEPSQAALRRSLSEALSTHSTRKPQLVGLLPFDHGQRLRAACRLTSLEDSSTAQGLSKPLVRRWSLSEAASSAAATANCELVATVQFELRGGGTTYAWGEAENGRLGLGDPSSAATDPSDEGEPLFQDGHEALTDSTYRFVAQPTPIPALMGVELRQLVCGSAHSLAVTTQGKVFSWGRGVRGQLGHATAEGSTGSASDEWTPRLVRGLRYERIAQAVATDQSSLFLSEVVSPSVYEQRRRQVARLRSIAKKSEVPATED